MTALSRKSANELLEAYARQFGEAHLLLAMHAAVPLGLAPEMLHLIRINFVSHAPWIAEADLLLSTLCREAGDEMYQMKPEVREGLLSELKLDSEFGMRRVREVAGFLYAWTERELNRSKSSIRKDFLKAQQLAAIAWLEPKRAAQLIAAELQNAQLSQSDSELVRISKLTEQLAEPLMNEDDLLLYVAGMNHIESGQNDLANAAFAQLGSGSVSIAGADLSLPSVAPVSNPERSSGRAVDPKPDVVSQSNIGDSNVVPDSDQGIDDPYKTDIFISYSKIDEDIALNDSDDGLVLMFHEDLDDVLKHVLRIPGSIATSNEIRHDELLQETLPSTAILLIVYTRNWLDSEFAQQELQAFLEANRSRGIRESAIRNRIILLPLEFVDLSALPTELRHCAQLPLGLEGVAGNAQLAHRESTGEALERYRKTMNDLANMLVSQLRTTQNKDVSPDNPLFINGDKLVFLSDASEDLHGEYLRLADIFRANDYQVLPSEPMGSSGMGSLARYLVVSHCAEKASLAIQLVGEKRHKLDIDSIDAVTFDNNMTLEVAKRTGKLRYIWAPNQEDIDLGDNPDAFYGAEVIRGTFDQLLSAIEEAIPDFQSQYLSEEDIISEEDIQFRSNLIYFSYFGNRFDEEWVPLREKMTERFGVELISGKEKMPTSGAIGSGLQSIIEQSEIVLAMIGPYWLQKIKNANADVTKLESYEDWLLFELMEASRQNKYIIPVLYGLDAVPTDPDLPPEILKLSEVEPLRISGKNAERDIEHAISFIDGFLEVSTDDYSTTGSAEAASEALPRVYMAYRDRHSGQMARQVELELKKKIEHLQMDSHYGSIPLGQTAPEYFRDRMEFSSAVLVFMDKWFDEFINSDDDRLIDDPKDWLRLQIEVALELDIPIIPILVNGADMPMGDELPESVRPITTRQAIRMAEQYFTDDIEALARAVNFALEQAIGRSDDIRAGERESGRATEEGFVTPSNVEARAGKSNASETSGTDTSTPDLNQGKKIFLSMNTGTDMTGHMRAALGAIKRSGHRQVQVETGGSVTTNVYFQDLEELLKQTDMFILVLGERMPLLPGSDRSIIEEEYEVARRVGVQTRILMPPLTVAIKASPGSEVNRLREFRSQLEGENPVFFYQSPEDVKEGITGFIENEFGYPEEPIQQQTIDPVENIPQQQTIRAEAPAEEVYFHPFDGSEYVLIPGGQYIYSVTGETVRVPDRWFGMYPVTIEKYQSFIDYLQDNNAEAANLLPLEVFIQSVNELARRVDGMAEYLYGSYNKLAEHLKPQTESRNPASGDDHPVTGISWFAARIYCFWLGMLEDGNVDNAAEIYSLPSEEEWEWAASGGERTYPWPNELGEPSADLANFGYNLGETNPVDAYPQGATPRGLMDMAGNVWEWCANRFSTQDDNRTLRGGAFHTDPELLRCSARNNHLPHNANNNYGFRVVRREPPDMS